MMLLDTHIWVWWVHDDPQLPVAYRSLLTTEEPNGLSVSAISCWEVAMLAARGRLQLPLPSTEWLQQALTSHGISLLPLSPAIAVESAMLPGSFHRDPADQIIVATARVHDVPLVTLDARIRNYSHVRLAP